jgi:hypothetical protein
MSISISRDALMERVSAGERLSADDIRHLAATSDILSIGMLADVLRRRVHETRTTFLPCRRVCARCSGVDPAHVKAQEIRINGSPRLLRTRFGAVEVVKSKAIARERVHVSDVERIASGYQYRCGADAAARRGPRQLVGSCRSTVTPIRR